MSLYKARSRKQEKGWQISKTGQLIQFLERREDRYSGDIVAAGLDSTIYTCPANRKAKICYAALSTKTGEGYIEVRILGVPTFLLHTYQPASFNYQSSYENGIGLNAGDTVTIFCGAAAGNFTIGSVQIVEEEVSTSYFTQDN